MNNFCQEMRVDFHSNDGGV